MALQLQPSDVLAPRGRTAPGGRRLAKLRSTVQAARGPAAPRDTILTRLGRLEDELSGVSYGYTDSDRARAVEKLTAASVARHRAVASGHAAALTALALLPKERLETLRATLARPAPGGTDPDGASVDTATVHEHSAGHGDTSPVSSVPKKAMRARRGDGLSGVDDLASMDAASTASVRTAMRLTPGVFKTQLARCLASGGGGTLRKAPTGGGGAAGGSKARAGTSHGLTACETGALVDLLDHTGAREAIDARECVHLRARRRGRAVPRLACVGAVPA